MPYGLASEALNFCPDVQNWKRSNGDQAQSLEPSVRQGIFMLCIIYYSACLPCSYFQLKSNPLFVKFASNMLRSFPVSFSWAFAMILYKIDWLPRQCWSKCFSKCCCTHVDSKELVCHAKDSENLMLSQHLSISITSHSSEIHDLKTLKPDLVFPFSCLNTLLFVLLTSKSANDMTNEQARLVKTMATVHTDSFKRYPGLGPPLIMLVSWPFASMIPSWRAQWEFSQVSAPSKPFF